jgi:hypothetical protein
MASNWYTLALQEFLAGAIDLQTDTIKVALVQITGTGTPYTVDITTDQFLSVIPSGAIVATSPALTTKVIANGIFGADDTVFTGVGIGPAAGALVIYKDTGSAGTSNLLLYLDSSNYSGLPVTPNGGNINVAFSGTGNLIAAV